MKSKASQESRFLRIISIPVRALSKARDLYVKSMTEYADRMNYGSLMAIPVTSQVPVLSRSFSASSARSSNGEDFRELVRASSTQGFGDMVDLDLYIKDQMKMSSGSWAGPRAMPTRSSSVAMGRIDEDRPCCYFGEDSRNFIGKNETKYPRRRSHAVSARKLSAF